jgi:nucleotide sugar dehydrogenase
MSNVVVIGQGYVGLPMALRAAASGHSVTGLELNARTADNLNAGVSHIDDVSAEELAAGLQQGYRATTDKSCIAGADVVVVCVPTPLSADGGPDLSAVEATASTIGEYVTEGTLCILESTTYPGTTEEIFTPLITRDKLVVGEDVFIAFSPERIDPGNHIFGVKNTPKVVGGITGLCTEKASEFYSTFIDKVVSAKGAKEAEMSKLLENTFRHVNIALVNEMVRFCRDLDINLWDAIDAAETKPFGFMAFRPGPGVGGHCIPIDPSYLSHRVKAKLGYAFRMVELAEEINHAAPDYVAHRCWEMLNSEGKAANGAKVLLIGVAYKPNISDQRESPALPLAKKLVSWGVEISYFDSLVPTWAPFGLEGESYRTVEDIADASSSADLIVLLQNHRDVDLGLLAQSAVPVLDTRGVIDGGVSVERL